MMAADTTTTGFQWIASYPKSGNTWLRLALLALSQGDDAVDLSRTHSFAPMASARSGFDAWLDLSSSDLSDAEVTDLRPRFHAAQARSLTTPLLRKVHDAWTYARDGTPLFAPAVTHATIYLVRDPRDVALSFAHHRACSVDDAIGLMADSACWLARKRRGDATQLPQQIGSWSSNVASWLDAPGMPTPLLIRYEDMLAAPEDMVRHAAVHLGWTTDSAAIARAVAATRFDVLQAQEAAAGFPEKPQKSSSFFRRGVAGGWRDALSRDQASRICRDQQVVMERLGYLP